MRKELSNESTTNHSNYSYDHRSFDVAIVGILRLVIWGDIPLVF